MLFRSFPGLCVAASCFSTSAKPSQKPVSQCSQAINVDSFSGKSYDKPRARSRFASAFAAALALSSPATTQLFHHQLTGFDSYTGIQEYLHPATLQSPFYLAHPMALKAKKNADPDLPSLKASLSGPHAEHFWKAMDREIESLEGKGTWDVVDRSTVPEGIKVIPGTWAQRSYQTPP